MIQVEFKGKKKKSYLIFDEKEFTNSLFDKARRNIIDKNP